MASFSTSVTGRLRLAFVVILSVMGLTAIVGGHQLYRLADAQNRSIEQSVPALSYSQDLHAQLTQFQELLFQLDNVRTAAQVSWIQGRLMRLNQRLQDTVSSLTELALGDVRRSDLIDALKHVRNLASDTGRWRTDMLGLTTGLAEQRQALGSTRKQMQDFIEPLLLQGSTKIESYLVSEFDIQRESVNAIDRRDLADLFTLDHLLTEMLFRSYAAIDQAVQLSTQPKGTDWSAHTAQIQFNIRTVVRILATIEDAAIQQPLALHIEALREAVFDAHGIVPSLQAYAKRDSEFSSARQELLQVTQNVSDSTISIVETARNALEKSSTQIQRALANTVVSLFLCALLILSITLYVLMSIVECQLSRRMATLTESVLAIADGNVDHSVNVTGGDELGQMAKALEVFKSNDRELHRSNSELEQFAYAAAHDLRTPLQDIVSLAEWTIEDGEDELSDTCQEHLQKLLKRAKRLAKLQHDMLAYSKAGESNTSVGIFDVVNEMDNLSELLDANRRFELTVTGDCLTFTTYVTPLRQILLNLLTNTIKHHDRDSGEVHVAVHCRVNRLHVSFTDDGQGIEPQYQSKIFELFKSLQTKDAVEGSGMGLSLVQKVIKHHGGTITVSSNPERRRGTTFEFDWPILSEAANETSSVDVA